MRVSKYEWQKSKDNYRNQQISHEIYLKSTDALFIILIILMTIISYVCDIENGY